MAGVWKKLLLLTVLLMGVFHLTIFASASDYPEHPYGSFDNFSWVFNMTDRAISLNSSLPMEETKRCFVSFYSQDNKFICCSYADFLQGTTDFSVPVSMEDIPDNFSMKIFFTDINFCPISAAAEWEIAITQPTCTGKGYTMVCSDDTSYICAVVPALGHSWGEWSTLKDAGTIEPGTCQHTCSVCQVLEYKPVYPDAEIPILRMYGDISNIEKRSEVAIQTEFSGAGIEFSNWAALKYQGHSSIVYDKKNFTIKFYQDETHSQADKYTFYDWNKESKYILKANYVDPSKCRNLVCADLWSEICMCRDGTKHIKKLFNYGAIDGMPVAVYLNDSYIGLYDMVLHKDDDLYDLDKDQLDALMIINQCTMDEALFKAPAVFSDESNWELEFCGTEDQTWAKEQLNNTIDFICTASDEDFSNNKVLKEYFNIDSAVDYMLTMYAFGLTNSYAKNLVLLSYGGDPWIFSMFDMEDAFGLYQNGTGVYDASYMLPSCTDGVWDSGTGSILWDRLLANYQSRITARYTQLRQSIFTVDYILGKVQAQLDKIPVEFFEADLSLYPDMPRLENTTQQISHYLIQRFALLDQLFLSETEEQGE